MYKRRMRGNLGPGTPKRSVSSKEASPPRTEDSSDTDCPMDENFLDNVSKITHTPKRSQVTLPSPHSLTRSRVLATSTQNNEDVVRTSSSSTRQRESSSERSGSKMSQVKSLDSTRTTSNKENYFEMVLTKAGVVLDPGDNPHEITCKQTEFARKVTKLLEEHANHPANVNEFMQGFNSYCNSEDQFKKLLAKSKLSEDCDEASGVVQESLIHSLLGVDGLQTQIADVLLEKIVDLSFEGSENADGDDIPWVRMILRQLRFLDNVVNGTSLCERLFAVLDAAPCAVQREIIFCLPDIIADAQHYDAALELSKLLQSNFSLCPAILDALTNLSVPADLQKEIGVKMLEHLRTAPTEFLPNIVNFLVVGVTPDNIPDVVAGLRAELDVTPMAHKRKASPSEASSAVLTVANLSTVLIVSPALATAWIKAIVAVESVAEHRPLDIIVMLVLHSDVAGRRKVVEALFRTKAKDGLFRNSLLERTFNSFHVVLKDYLQTVLDISLLLLRSTEPPISQHGATWFRMCLVHMQGYSGQTVLCKLILNVGTCSHMVTRSVLDILTEIGAKHLDKLVPHSIVLLGLLDKMEMLDLGEARQLMDLLCKLAFRRDQGSEALLHDDINILVRKQLGHCNPMVKRKGVVGAVLAAKHIGMTDGDDMPTTEESTEPSCSEDVLLSSRGKQAVEMLDLVLLSIVTSPETLALFLDQLCCMISRNKALDSTLEDWIREKMVDGFQQNYIVDMEGYEEGLDLMLQYYLDSNQESPIAVNIGPLVALEQGVGRDRMSDYTMPVAHPMFRLLHILHSRGQDKSRLADIDALLGCAVVLPRPSRYSDFSSLDPDERREALDCLFHCLNWFREVTNAFAAQPRAVYQKKVLQRLHNIVNLQRLLARCLPQLPGYQPPQCQFYVTAKPIQADKAKKPSVKRKPRAKGAKKRKRGTDDTGEGGDDSPPCTPDTPEAVPEALPPADLALYKDYFRELDMDLFCLLRWELTLQPAVKPAEGQLNTDMLIFLLEDYVAKTEHMLPASVKRATHLKGGQGEGQSRFLNLDNMRPHEYVKEATKYFPEMCSKLELVAGYCQNLVDDNDGVLDGPSMFTPGTAGAKLCLELLLRGLAATLGWVEFVNNTHSTILKDCLREIASRQHPDNRRLGSVSELVARTCDYLNIYTGRVLHLPGACNLAKLVEVVSKFTEGDSVCRNILSPMCLQFLSHRWYALNGKPESGTVYNQNVEYLLRTYLGGTRNPLKVLRETLTWLETELQALSEKDGVLQTLPAINKANFPLLFRHLCSTLALCTQRGLVRAKDSVEKFKMWQKIIDMLEKLVKVAQDHQSRSNLVALLKMGRVVLKLFLTQGMPVFEDMLPRRTEAIVEELGKLQHSTRFYNQICYHCKVSGDGALTAHVPPIRFTLETLVFRVKAALVANGQSAAFWMGNLRNKTLKGDEVLSQSTVADDEVEEDLPEDETSDPELDLVDAGEESSTTNPDSLSQIY